MLQILIVNKLKFLCIVIINNYVPYGIISIIASGKAFADGLGGSVVAARKSSPIILVDDQVPNSIKNMIDSKCSQINHITVLGGEGTVSNVELNQLNNLEAEYYFTDLLKPYYKYLLNYKEDTFLNVTGSIFVGLEWIL